YTTSEPNSVSAIAEYQEKAGDFGFTIEALGVTAQSEVTQATDTLIAKNVDCFSNLTDNNVVGVLSSVLEKTNEAGIPVYGSEVEQVKIGCVAAAGIDYYQLGRQTGAIAARILKGEAKASGIPYEVISEYGIYVNSEAIAAMDLTVPADVAARMTEAKDA
ncbi:MAG: ABC transporter substrate-binding protein, partial [Clostridiales bacterium]|nr:ABC transporter substrate-binding protein [Clostridiales bacterium]